MNQLALKFEIEKNTEDEILHYLMQGHSLTTLDCIRIFHSTELRKYISNIKDRGYDIGSTWINGKNSLGLPTRYKRYYIETNNELPIAQVEKENLEREYMQSRGI